MNRGTSYKFQVTSCRDQVTGIQVTGCRLQVSGFPPEAGPPLAESLKLVTCSLQLVTCSLQLAA